MVPADRLKNDYVFILELEREGKRVRENPSFHSTLNRKPFNPGQVSQCVDLSLYVCKLN